MKKCSRRQGLLQVPEVHAPHLRVSRPYRPRRPCPAVLSLKAETKLVSVQSTAALLSLRQFHKDADAEKTFLSALRRCSRRLNSCWSDMWPQAFANFWAVHPDQHHYHVDGGNGLSHKLNVSARFIYGQTRLLLTWKRKIAVPCVSRMVMSALNDNSILTTPLCPLHRTRASVSSTLGRLTLITEFLWSRRA